MTAMRARSGHERRPGDPAVPVLTFRPEGTEYRGVRTGNKRGNKSSILPREEMRSRGVCAQPILTLISGYCNFCFVHLFLALDGDLWSRMPISSITGPPRAYTMPATWKRLKKNSMNSMQGLEDSYQVANDPGGTKVEAHSVR